jgi:hypothetical protein
MSRKLNVSGVLNELRGSSVFFNKPVKAQDDPAETDVSRPRASEETQPPSEQSPTPSSEADPAQINTPNERTEFRTEKRSENRTVALPTQRRTRRYSYEFYEDQILAIKKLKYDAEMAGHRVKLSDFAREAFDLYLQDKRGGERTDNRSENRTVAIPNGKAFEKSPI